MLEHDKTVRLKKIQNQGEDNRKDDKCGQRINTTMYQPFLFISIAPYELLQVQLKLPLIIVQN